MSNNKTEELTILSIDAWNDGEGGWTWNQWVKSGHIPVECLTWTTRKILKYFREAGYFNQSSIGKLTVNDNGYNITILNRYTLEPLYAVEYGCHTEWS